MIVSKFTWTISHHMVILLRMVLEKLENVLKRCKHTHISLIIVKCHMMIEEGIILGNVFSFARIWVDPTKVEVFLNFPTLKT